MPGTFKYRVLVVDDDETLLETTAAMLAHSGYLVETARDGFEALAALRDAEPEILVTDLNMPKMSGFELLAVIRKRFPRIGVIVCNGAFSPSGSPEGVLTDRFLHKGENCGFEIVEAVRELITQLPVRPQHAKPEVAPVWLPRSDSAYVILTCPSCLRSSSLRSRNVAVGIVQSDACVHCGEHISYCMDKTATREPSVAETLHARVESTKRKITESRMNISESKKRISESRH
jgi:CheY-like chemotaxis protein